MKSASTIRRNQQALRAIIDSDDSDAVLKRIAYAMETALTWATVKTVDWPSMDQEAHLLAALLRKELKS